MARDPDNGKGTHDESSLKPGKAFLNYRGLAVILTSVVIVAFIVIASGALPFQLGSGPDQAEDGTGNTNIGIHTGEQMTYNVSGYVSDYTSSIDGLIALEFDNVTTSGSEVSMEYWFCISCNNPAYEPYVRSWHDTISRTIEWNGLDGTGAGGVQVTNGHTFSTAHFENRTVDLCVRALDGNFTFSNTTFSAFHQSWCEDATTHISYFVHSKMSRTTGGQTILDMDLYQTNISTITLPLGDRAINVQTLTSMMASQVLWKNMSAETGIYYDHEMNVDSGIRSGDQIIYSVSGYITGYKYSMWGWVILTFNNVTRSGSSISMHYYLEISSTNWEGYSDYYYRYKHATLNWSVNWNGSDGNGSGGVEVTENWTISTTHYGNETVDFCIQDLRGSNFTYLNHTIYTHYQQWSEDPITHIPYRVYYIIGKQIGWSAHCTMDLYQTNINSITLPLGDRASSLQAVATAMAVQGFWVNMDPLVGIYYDHGGWWVFQSV